MQFSKLLSASALLAAVSAYTVTSPTLNSTITKGTTIDVEWTSVDTDASTFSIYLVNFQTAHWPPTVLSLAQDVPQSAGSQEVRIPCDVTSDYGWQINFINGTNTYVIYAQSAKFTLTGECVDPTTSSSVPVVTTTVINNVTTTVTATAAVNTAVETVIYETPVIWFVQPSAVVAAAAMCPPAAQQTVTVFANGPAPVTCGGGSYPTHAPGSGYTNYTTTAAGHKTTVASTGAASTTTKAVAFTGAASNVKVGGGALALAAAVALLL